MANGVCVYCICWHSLYSVLRMHSFVLYANEMEINIWQATDSLSVPWLMLSRLRRNFAHTVPTHYHHPLV